MFHSQPVGASVWCKMCRDCRQTCNMTTLWSGLLPGRPG